MPAVPHPAERFTAPRSIQTGVPLKHLLDPVAVELLAESIAAVHSRFPRSAFLAQALTGLEALELMPRAAHLGTCLRDHLPRPLPEAWGVLEAALGPALTATSGFGLKPFFYLPHVAFIRDHLVEDLETGLEANHAITRRWSGEFSIRPYLLRNPEATLSRLHVWATDPDPHVRRLVSEGSRPRLPWAPRLPHFIADPSPTLVLLELLKDDASEYVRRSVANHLGDIAKDHPDRALAVARRWLDEVAQLPPATVKRRRALIRHAIRHPARQGLPAAVALRQAAR